MDDKKVPQPTTPGSRTFQSAGACASIAQQDLKEAMQYGDYGAVGQIHNSVPEEHWEALRMVRHKIGGDMGGATFCAGHTFVPEKEERAADNPGSVPDPRLGQARK